MKKTVCIAMIAVLTSVTAVLPAGATTCLCVGSSNGKTCGNGGVGGSFLRVDSPAARNLQYYLLTAALQAQLNAVGKAYDPTSGWFCWNGTLQ